jgi:hypothetical protein
MNNRISPKKVTSFSAPFRFTIATLVTDMVEYNQMLDSYKKAGFSEDIAEYIYIDNCGKNSFDAYKGLNMFLQTAQGEYIIICHQDVLINYDDVDVLNAQLEKITKLDPNWAILSNAGGLENDLYHRIVSHVVYEDGHEQVIGELPQKVGTVDENFMVIKRSANLALSRDLSGFHLYGTDICLVAELLGYSAYAIDFKLVHKSYGNPGDSYYKILENLVHKYAWFMRSRTVLTTITDFRLSSSALNRKIFSTLFAKRMLRRDKKYEYLKAQENKANK